MRENLNGTLIISKSLKNGFYLHAKEMTAGDGERPNRYILCCNPEAKERDSETPKY